MRPNSSLPDCTSCVEHHTFTIAGVTVPLCSVLSYTYVSRLEQPVCMYNRTLFLSWCLPYRSLEFKKMGNVGASNHFNMTKLNVHCANMEHSEFKLTVARNC